MKITFHVFILITAIYGIKILHTAISVQEALMIEYCIENTCIVDVCTDNFKIFISLSALNVLNFLRWKQRLSKKKHSLWVFHDVVYFCEILCSFFHFEFHHSFLYSGVVFIYSHHWINDFNFTAILFVYFYVQLGSIQSRPVMSLQFNVMN